MEKKILLNEADPAAAPKAAPAATTPNTVQPIPAPTPTPTPTQAPASDADWNDDWPRKYSTAATHQDRRDVLELFCKAFCKAVLGNTYDDTKPIDTFKGALIDQLEAFGAAGLKYNSNPFLQFIATFKSAGCNLAVINNNAYSTLNSLYGDQIIIDKDLEGKGLAGIENILFVEDLYNTDIPDFRASMKYRVQFFYWASSSSNIRSLQLSKLSAEQYNKFLEILNGSAPNIGGLNVGKGLSNIKYFRNFVLFKSGAYTHSGKGTLRSAEQITKAIDYLDSLVGATDTASTEAQFISNLNPAAKDFVKPLDLNKLDKKQAQLALKYLMDKYKINLGIK